jgi:hypothetical protein
VAGVVRSSRGGGSFGVRFEYILKIALVSAHVVAGLWYLVFPFCLNQCLVL